MDLQIPEDFLCPLTHDIMENPLMSKHGFSFERDAIIEWVDRQGTCPLSRQPLSLSGLIQNRLLKKQIQDWKASQGMPDSTPEHADGSDRDIYTFADNAAVIVCLQNERFKQQISEKGNTRNSKNTHTSALLLRRGKDRWARSLISNLKSQVRRIAN